MVREGDVAAFRAVPVPVAESLEEVRAKIVAGIVAEEGVDALRHHNVVALKYAEILVSPGGIGGNPAVRR